MLKPADLSSRLAVQGLSVNQNLGSRKLSISTPEKDVKSIKYSVKSKKKLANEFLILAQLYLPRTWRSFLLKFKGFVLCFDFLIAIFKAASTQPSFLRSVEEPT